ncbi:MAG: ribbon-helix-helix domain-containing protein [Alphaproteobacteria bacterium]|nr:ribbon-helix-helix domain-containing protein [Alphaproteobacteria bacterium]
MNANAKSPKKSAPHNGFQSRNIRLDGKRTSIRLETALWEALEDIGEREAKSIGELCAIIAERKTGTNLTASVRLFIIAYFRLAAHGGAKPTLVKLSAASTQRRKSAYSQLMSSALTRIV